MHRVTGVRFKKTGKIYYFSPGDLNIETDDYVVVETARGTEFGKAVIGMKEVGDNDVVLPLKQVQRIATEKDKQVITENHEEAAKAFELCSKKITEHELDMKLVDVEYTFDRNKVLFYFTADGRIDFRNLVKDLASVFRTRIELRQIGVRDEAKMLGGIGPCGRMLCCSTFLGDFEPVSIKMAKDQNLSLNPTKISGLCGRLMCCLKYENDMYEEAKHELPDMNEKLNTSYGKGKVKGLNMLERLVQVEIFESGQVVEFTLDELLEEGAVTAKKVK
ncbi:PSP1 domain-containing protein [Salisediminibacterium halotolerans]|uniref:Cell fate regulator YaaT, PSP1 superfamily (Controls sporulation, competence, biofilm development) n=1 Tax=Salisediminibacterium halotolerans TaxID=517425 RepID=A0A1H9VRL9_9BACI|nr:MULTISPECIES: stage 0 sporulation family protein [Salisediminibacterium]RLJ80969.1 cell fate regulator YaaT (PSP1 superfamily) [Actinophytocola xinjiangensis]RPE83626.1 cell fate regulator YaaT (PSP1 superfamily) [Salisediminibacterium halotolerans]TWG37894.1 cell fate regulator YaaT (PSP1 superfamily) [Salisediminibacterium halotolerans]SES24027.1 Cell fate regulator YaaT, PSP1 superfamily (controls sporulation, competence, biofilm development) [Salisediminibacterium haloalkalitolerans]GEL